MIEQQIRPWDVLDQRVLDAIAGLPREAFVGAEYRQLAYSDTALPLGEGRLMMPPRLEARLAQSLRLRPTDKVLEIGTGSGYVTALMARLAGHVYSVERSAPLARAARERLAQQDIVNVTLATGDGLAGWPENAPFDAIAVTGSLPEPSEVLARQLALDGRLFVVVGHSPVMEALLLTRTGAESWARESLFETDLPRLAGADEPEPFVL